MGDVPELVTSTTLLQRVQDPANREAHNEFVRRYQPAIHEWCRSSGLQEADAEDATQDVLEKLLASMRIETFDREKGTFRGWLWKVTRHAVLDMMKKRDRPGLGSGDSKMWEYLQTVEAQQGLKERLMSTFDLEVQEEAMARVQRRVYPDTWRVFFLRSVEQQPAADVAAILNKPVTAVHMANSRVLAMIKNTIQKLDVQE